MFKWLICLQVWQIHCNTDQDKKYLLNSYIKKCVCVYVHIFPIFYILWINFYQTRIVDRNQICIPSKNVFQSHLYLKMFWCTKYLKIENYLFSILYICACVCAHVRVKSEDDSHRVITTIPKQDNKWQWAEGKKK